MRVLVVEPEHRPEVREIDGSLAAMQSIVGGLIQPVRPFEDSVVLVCNDEGKLMNLSANRGLSRSSGTRNGSTRPKCSGVWMAGSSVCHWRLIEHES